jgi:hypothetical protein
MATHQLAQGLASLGRYGDSMLMHVSPSEVAGLKAVGAMTGHKLHTNPHTGMPEAFDFGDFFTSLLPMAAGILLAPGTGGASLVASSLGQTAAAAAPVVAGMATGAVVAGAKGEDPLMGGLMGGLGGYGGGNIGGSLGKMGAAGGYEAGSAASKSLVGPQLTQAGGLSSAGYGQGMATTLANQVAPTTFAEGMGNIGSGLKQLASDPMGKGFDAFKAAGGSGTQLATSIGIPALQAMQPKPIDTTEEEAKRKAEASKYVDPITGRLNPYQSSPSFGTMLMATGGTVNTNSSSIASGGIQDLYGTNDQTTGTQNLSKDGYGIGRLDNLASEGSRAKAADTFYAQGGPIAFAEGGSSNIYIPGYNSPSFSQGSLGGNPLLTLLAQMFAKQGLLNPQANTATASTSSTPSIPTTIDALNAPGMYPQASDDYMATKATDKGTFALEAAKGGYLDGAGDGMSDSIPGTIEGKQPARLADGEFVVPADVVSHIGNGSSKAGAKNLYAMMNKVRKARTGNPKQGKQINPNKYLPA